MSPGYDPGGAGAGLKRGVAAFASGALFAVALGLSGMTRPGKVLGFLDFAGRWDPSLACVMGGALLVCAATFALVLRRARPVLDARFHMPTPTRIDTRLVAGSALFGLGWGVSGFCPGPAIVSLASGSRGAVTFVVAMCAGMGLYELVERGLRARAGRRVSSPDGAVAT